MPMEEETISLIVMGSTVIFGISILITVLCWFRNKDKTVAVHGAYGSLIAHFLMLGITINSAIRTLSFNVMSEDGSSLHPMASEEISLRIGATGIVWAGSMICLMIAIIMFYISLRRG